MTTALNDSLVHKIAAPVHDEWDFRPVSIWEWKAGRYTYMTQFYVCDTKDGRRVIFAGVKHHKEGSSDIMTWWGDSWNRVGHMAWRTAESPSLDQISFAY